MLSAFDADAEETTWILIASGRIGRRYRYGDLRRRVGDIETRTYPVGRHIAGVVVRQYGSFRAIPLGQLAAAPLGAAFGYTRVTPYGEILYLCLALSPLTVPSVRKLRHEG